MSVLLSALLLAGVARALAFDHGAWDSLLRRHVLNVMAHGFIVVSA